MSRGDPIHEAHAIPHGVCEEAIRLPQQPSGYEAHARHDTSFRTESAERGISLTLWPILNELQLTN